MNSIFERLEYIEISERRKEFLHRLLQELKSDLDLRTVLDAGCGAGFFSDYLSRQGFEVVAFDGREKNVWEAKRRYPNIDFKVRDVEDRAIYLSEAIL
jgi:2-polyprenyl-3-methyl-5-hydroxy-6-metoxy-1,4-benzoquinol methylase